MNIEQKMIKVNTGFDLEAFRLNVLSDPLVYDIWHSKYRWKLADGTTMEDSVAETRERVVRAIYRDDPLQEAFDEALHAVQNGYFIPAGRINAGAGLDRRVTLTNCFVSSTIQDSLPGIQRVINQAAYTMQQGGGIGTDYSTVRPHGAIVKRTGSVSSGVIPFMDQQNGMCQTIESAGTRRGAMMGTLCDTHPDLWNPNQYEFVSKFNGTKILKQPSFISAKRQKDRLDQFNVSVLISDAFMEAVQHDQMWELGFHVPRADGKHVSVYDKPFPYNEIDYDNEGNAWIGNDRDGNPLRKKGDMAPWYVYRRVSARVIWGDIMRSTYVYAEPGVIFIDRVNRLNNLIYCEEIRCTNPCLTGDTLVAVVGRGPIPIKQLAEESVNIPVYAVNETTKEVAVRLGRNPRLTKKNATVIKIHLDDGSSIKATPDHKFILKDGSRIEAKNLKPQDSLMRVDVLYGATGVLINGILEQHLIAEAKYKKKFDWGRGRGKFHAHHVNFDHSDNSWNNIEALTHEDHNSLHLSGDLNPMRMWWVTTLNDSQKQDYRDKMSLATTGDKNGMWGKTHNPETLIKIGSKTSERFQDPVFKKHHKDAVKASMTEETCELISIAAKARYQTMTKICEECKTEFVVRAKSTSTAKGQQKVCGSRCAAKIASRVNADLSRGKPRPSSVSLKLKGRVFTESHREALRAAAINRYKKQTDQPFNHKVIGIEILESCEDVYNITVDEHHNFAIVTTISNNKYSCISVSNCGEQPLPEHGTCCLGSVNAAFMVKNPFTPQAIFDLSLFRKTVRTGVRFLDNVLTVTEFPLRAQKEESDAKRRIGLGVTGWADALAQLGVIYGSDASIKLSKVVAAELQEHSYLASMDLARERGSFPLYDYCKMLASPNIQKLPAYMLHHMKSHGLRNGVLNTVAPNGTISVYTGNTGSGIEPFFSVQPHNRNVRQADGSTGTYISAYYAVRLHQAMYPELMLPDCFVGAEQVSPLDHVRVQAAWQGHIDASISKTINCSVDLTFEDFENVYTEAYNTGCKGCTTYRPDPTAGRGSVLSEDKPKDPLLTGAIDLLKVMAGMTEVVTDMKRDEVRDRPEVVDGRTHKLKWPPTAENIYVNVTRVGDEPLELFIKHADATLTEWTDGLSRMITGIMRRGGDVRFIVEQLKQVGSTKGGAFINGEYYFSQVAAIGGIIEKELNFTSAPIGVDVKHDKPTAAFGTDLGTFPGGPGGKHSEVIGEKCPQCNAMTFIRENGCKKCLTCLFEACG